jgi:hypothetical protein
MPEPAKPIYPNGGGLVQYGLNRWRETGPKPGGHRKFWYLAKCLYDGGLDRPTVEEHLTREKDIAHNPAEREEEIPAILEGFFGESPLEQGCRASDPGGLIPVVSQVEMSRAQRQHLSCL